MGAGEPNVVGAKAGDSARQLVNEQALYAAIKSLAGVAQRAESGASGEGSIGGGAGRVTAWSRPDLVVAAPAGIAAFTPAALFASAGSTVTAVAGQDLQLAAQANQAWAIKGGLVFYTYGKATNASKPNTETGIRLHAATGNVNMQSQSGATRLTADKKIEVASTGGMVRVAAPRHVLLTAAGAAIDIQPGNITLKGPGKIEFKASTGFPRTSRSPVTQCRSTCRVWPTKATTPTRLASSAYGSMVALVTAITDTSTPTSSTEC